MIGLGYVGAVTAVCLARDGHDVIGVDLDRTKVDLLAAGQPPIIEEGLQQVTTAAASSGRLKVQDRLDESVAGLRPYLCLRGYAVGPERKSEPRGRRARSRNSSASCCGKASGFPVVVLRSTVPPGTTDAVVAPLLAKASGRKVNEAFGLCFQPEFLREGSSVKDYYNPPFTIVGSESDKAIEVVRSLFGDLPGRVHCDRYP